MQTEERIYLPYPAWAKAELCCKIFGIGIKQLYQMRKNGNVLVRERGPSVTYNCHQIYQTMTAEAIGQVPPVVNRDNLQEAMKR